jgi:hypothetical protein
MKPLLTWRKISLAHLMAGAVAPICIPTIAADMKAWEDSINLATKERYIPVELWTGAECDGKKS